MICLKCEYRIVLWAFSKARCEICETEVVTQHTPPNKLCSACSEKHNKCEGCGKKMNVTK